MIDRLGNNYRLVLDDFAINRRAAINACILDAIGASKELAVR